MDQTGIVLVSGGNEKIYKIKGAHQVSLHGKDKKQTFIAVLFVVAIKKVLSTQCV